MAREPIKTDVFLSKSGQLILVETYGVQCYAIDDGTAKFTPTMGLVNILYRESEYLGRL